MSVEFFKLFVSLYSQVKGDDEILYSCFMKVKFDSY